MLRHTEKPVTSILSNEHRTLDRLVYYLRYGRFEAMDIILQGFRQLDQLPEVVHSIGEIDNRLVSFALLFNKLIEAVSDL